MEKVNEIYELIKQADESLSGTYWTELNYSYRDTPKDIIDNVVNTYMNNDISGVENITDTDKRLALAKYLEDVTDKLRMKSEYDIMLSCFRYLPFKILGYEAGHDDKAIKFKFIFNTPYDKEEMYITINLDYVIEHKKKKSEFDYKYESLRILANALKAEIS